MGQKHVMNKPVEIAKALAENLQQIVGAASQGPYVDDLILGAQELVKALREIPGMRAERNLDKSLDAQPNPLRRESRLIMVNDARLLKARLPSPGLGHGYASDVRELGVGRVALRLKGAEYFPVKLVEHWAIHA